MASKILLLFVGVFLLCAAGKIPEKISLLGNEVETSTDLFLASSGGTDDELPSDFKFDIAKLVRELLDKLRGILEKLLDFAESQFRKALEKGNGVIKKIEAQTKLRIEELNAEISNALDEETVRMQDSLEKIKKTISEVGIDPCAGSVSDEIKCWTKELAKVTKALLYIPKEVSKQTAQTVLDIGSISIDIVSTASDTIEKAETIEKQMINELKGCVPSAG
nr:unnamed protein product [Callosobruchus chinensis]